MHAVSNSITSATVLPQRPLRARAWWCMRQMVVFGLDDLLRTVAVGVERDATDNLRQWCKALTNAGVLQRIQPHRGAPVWRLQRDIGPLPPIWQRRSDAIFDPNSNIHYSLANPCQEYSS